MHQQKKLRVVTIVTFNKYLRTNNEHTIPNTQNNRMSDIGHKKSHRALNTTQTLQNPSSNKRMNIPKCIIRVYNTNTLYYIHMGEKNGKITMTFNMYQYQLTECLLLSALIITSIIAIQITMVFTIYTDIPAYVLDSSFS